MSAVSKRTDGVPANGQAIATICFGVFCLVLNDALAKWLTAHYGPLQIIFLRNLFALPMITVIALSLGGRASLRSSHMAVHAMRGLLMVVAGFAFFSGLKILPLAEATSLVFAAPIFITALSVPLLGESVGWRRWAAVSAGFLGVLIIVRPGAAAFQPASLFVVATAMFYALFMISARWVKRDENVWTMMFYVVLFPLLFSGMIVPFQWSGLALSHIPHLVGMAIFGTLGMTLIGHSFRLAPAAIVAPFDYTALLWASVIGWLVWGELPDAWTYAGAAVIIASGIYIVLRETRQRQESARSKSFRRCL
ncbi:DMT family transporter [Chelativorans sp. YIM 93263]|uniref:DMT family transporter n=1 Tax=Chelativorans sp. YIM 93263 TaxID=2906648 RepID=UPI0023795BFB|nr:DMT family transporter [Chelativorans sp. YIM 93263]